jgi:transposase
VLELRRERHRRIRKSEPSEELDEWNGYTMMLTNIPKDKLKLKQILKMYKIRWQIELFFKNIKSYLHIDKLTGKNKYRILILIYTKLILTWMAALLYAYAQMIADEGKEVSKFKFTKWLQEEFGWRKAFITADFTELIETLQEDLDFLCKQSTRKQKSWVEGIAA